MIRQWMVLGSTMLITFVLGSVHAFSVFVADLEILLQLPRSQISLIYSFALVFITVAVLVGYRLYSQLSCWWTILVMCVVAASGLWIATFASSWWILLIGYSIVFGFSNGLGYGYCLQLAGSALPEIKGFAMGAVTAAYAVGSIVFAQIFGFILNLEQSEGSATNLFTAFHSLAVAILVAGVISACLLRAFSVSYALSTSSSDDNEIQNRKKLVQFWIAYMTSVFAGLMAIGHAAGIAVVKGASIEQSTLSATMIGVGSALGGFLSGWLVDRWPAGRFLIALPLLSGFALLSIFLTDTTLVAIFSLAIVGFSYGAVIAIYPVVISNEFGRQGVRAYGLIFIAWGFSGLVAPWLAGAIYDWQGQYQMAMVIAAVLALVSSLCVYRFKLCDV